MFNHMIDYVKRDARVRGSIIPIRSQGAELVVKMTGMMLAMILCTHNNGEQ